MVHRHVGCGQSLRVGWALGDVLLSSSAGPSRTSIQVLHRHPPVLRMVLEALQVGEQRRGTSVAAIKVYILQKYPMVDVIRLKYLLKQALATGIRRGLLVRPVNSKAKGATGSFKVSRLGWVGRLGMGEPGPQGLNSVPALVASAPSWNSSPGTGQT